MKPWAFLFLLILPLAAHSQAADSDADGLIDDQESTVYFTDPVNSDTDGDGYLDGEEITNDYSPRYGDKKKLVQADSDNDGLNDAWEIILGTNLMKPDSDGDSYKDGAEVTNGYDPLTSQPVKLGKLIKVDIKTQRLAYYFGDKELDSFLISGGLKWTPTPLGKFTVLDKVPLKHYGGANFDYPNTKWNLHFTTGALGRYYIHGAYWHNNFGQPMSHCCVNVHYDNMERLYNFAQVGTRVEIN